MNEAITHVAGGIKCDNSTCDYRDDSVKHSDYKDWLNRPCPKCGDNLLTEGDYVAFNAILSMINSINESTAMLGVDTCHKDSESVAVRISFNGSGVPKMELGLEG